MIAKGRYKFSFYWCRVCDMCILPKQLKNANQPTCPKCGAPVEGK